MNGEIMFLRERRNIRAEPALWLLEMRSSEPKFRLSTERRDNFMLDRAEYDFFKVEEQDQLVKSRLDRTTSAQTSSLSAGYYEDGCIARKILTTTRPRACASAKKTAAEGPSGRLIILVPTIDLNSDLSREASALPRLSRLYNFESQSQFQGHILILT